MTTDTIYIATPEICHASSFDYDETRLPSGWPGKKFRLDENGKRAVLVGDYHEESIRSWYISEELSGKIKASVEAPVYTATPEMCHARSSDYGTELLPSEWSGKKFRLTGDGGRTFLVGDYPGGLVTSWNIEKELADRIKASAPADPTTEVTPETGPTAIVSLEKHEADLKSRESTIEQQREELERLRRMVDENTERHDVFKRRVGEVAMEYAERHDWCDTVKEALDELGVEVPQKKYSFTLSVVYRVTGTKEEYGEPDIYNLHRYMDLDADGVEVSMDGWADDIEVEYVQHDVMDIEEVQE